MSALRSDLDDDVTPGLGVCKLGDVVAELSKVYQELGAFSYSVWTSKCLMVGTGANGLRSFGSA